MGNILILKICTAILKGVYLLLLGAELPLVVESFGLLNDIFPFPSILDAGYPVFNTLWTGDADLRLYITTVQDG